LSFTHRTAAARHDASSPRTCQRVGSEQPSKLQSACCKAGAREAPTHAIDQVPVLFYCLGAVLRLVEEVHLKLASLLKLIRNPRLSLVVLMLAAIAMPTSGSSTFAADYRVEIGVDSRAAKDAGSLDCVIDEECSTRLEPLGLRIIVRVSSTDPDRASVRLYGDEPGCCYFNGDASSALVNMRDTLSRLPIFLRDRVRGNLFIENERPVGTLYLRFQRR
jgi:hypothetical protein